MGKVVKRKIHYLNKELLEGVLGRSGVSSGQRRNRGVRVRTSSVLVWGGVPSRRRRWP